MTGQVKNYGEYLLKKAIKPSYSRIKIFEYLDQNATHPTVDEIYNHLVGELPTLSKTTVYNTLKLLAEARLVNVITIEDNETRYDGNIAPHGHFKCEACSRVYDFEIDIAGCVTNGLEKFQIHSQDVYFKGACPDCLKNKN